ncbi:MAG: hypothetical protein GXP30_12265 [Verrucomicrobia bacterium]|nr:hypothetical protein [Verrucomicrobiota bacterium]
MTHDTFKIGDLTAVIGDNSAHETHRAGYNGVWSLRHKNIERDLFVPFYTGLNLEHIFSGVHEDEDSKVFFEPRNAPMTFKKISDSVAELYQPPTPTHHLESWTRFELVAPHYIDMTFRCRATQHVFDYDYIGLFWASYINAAEDKSLYFRGGMERHADTWSQFCTQAHDDESTLRHRDDNFALTFGAIQRNTLYRNHSPMRFDQHFYYGNFDELIWLTMFKPPQHGHIRFAHSPSGGGFNQKLQTTNCAWDFQYIIPDYEVMVDYTFSTRTALREKCSREEILNEFNTWSKTP